MIYNLFSYPNTKRFDWDVVYLAICYFNAISSHSDTVLVSWFFKEDLQK